MIIGRIEGANFVLGAPEGWDESKGECKGLPVRVEDTDQGQCLTSAWFPTPDEVRAILAGQPIYLSVFSKGHPPVWLRVEQPTPRLVLPS